MTRIDVLVVSLALAMVSVPAPAEAVTPITYVRWPGQACTTDPFWRSPEHVAVTNVALGNPSYTTRLQAFCPLPFLEARDNGGHARGVTAATVLKSPTVAVFDGSEHPTGGKVRAQIYQFDAAPNGNWSSCSNVFTGAQETGDTKLFPPYCNPAYQIVTLMVDLPKVSEEWFTGSAIRFYALDNW